MDTETINGAVWLLGFSTGECVVAPAKARPDWALTEMLRHGASEFCCYNLRYDAQALIAKLPRKTLWRLAVLGEAQWRGIRMRWIPDKEFEIQAAGHRVKIYDVAQFYHRRLDDAAREYLGEGKLEHSYDIAHLERYRDDPKAVVELSRYCIRDAQLAADLLEHVRSALGRVSPKAAAARPLSPAYLAGCHFLRDKGQRTKRRAIINRTFERAYYGGRVELFKRGLFDCPVYVYDLHSAYPAAAAKLESMRGMLPRIGRSPLSGAVYGCYHGTARVPEGLYFGPLPLRGGPVLTYPVGPVSTWFDLPALELLQEQRIPVAIDFAFEFHRGFRSDGALEFPDIPALYQLRRDPSLNIAVKLLLNGLYGKLAQRLELWDECGVEDAEDCVGGLWIRRRIEPGRYQDFPLAGAITSMTRAQVYMAAATNPRAVLFISTDGVASFKKLRLPLGDGLGEWGCTEYSGFLGISNGVYGLRDSQGNWDWKSRGFRNRAANFVELLERAGSDSVLNLEVQMPSTLRFALASGGTVNDLGTYTRRLDLNSDHKRYWPQRVCARDLLGGQFDSLPLTAAGVL